MELTKWREEFDKQFAFYRESDTLTSVCKNEDGFCASIDEKDIKQFISELVLSVLGDIEDEIALLKKKGYESESILNVIEIKINNQLNKLFTK